MEDIIKQLEILGITGKDADIYIELLRSKESTVIQLSKKTDIKRTSVYYCLDSLIKRGVVGMAIKNNKKLYYIENPKNSLNNIIKQQQSAVQALLPQIQDLYGKGSGLPEIKIYYNSSGIRNIFDDVLTCKEKLARYYVSDISVDEILGESFLKSFVKKRVALGIKSLSLRTDDYTPERETGYQLREIRKMPEGLSFSSYMCIYDNKSVVILVKEKIGFIIESNEFAEAQKAIFDTLWNISKSRGENDNEKEEKDDNYWSINK
jgi:sugar-specific transcriptional regulator TrmB